MIIADSGADMTPANMEKVIKAAGGKVDSFLPKLFCKMLEGKELKTYIEMAGKPGAGGGGGGGAAPALRPVGTRLRRRRRRRKSKRRRRKTWISTSSAERHELCWPHHSHDDLCVYP